MFYFRLALAMGMSVERLLREMSSAELNEWQAYYEIEPFGDRIADERHGIAAALVANINRDAKKRRDPYEPHNFIPWHRKNRNAAEKSDGILLAPEEQSKLLRQKLFRR